MTTQKHKNSLSILLGIPVILLVLSLVLNKIEKNSFATVKESNPYLKEMPNRYANILSTIKENKSSFFSTVIEDFTIRELIIFKTFPNSIDIKTDFIIELYPLNKKHLKDNNEFLTLNIVRDAGLFKNRDKTYGIFKAPLPIIDIEKLIIKQKGSNTKNELWVDVKEKPFKHIAEKVVVQKVKKGSDLTTPSPYSLLFTETLKQYNIEALPSFYSRRNDTLFNVSESLKNYCESNNRTIGKVNRPESFWKMINSRDQAIEKKINFNGKYSAEANQLLNTFIKEKTPFETVFNLKKLALFDAIQKVFTNNCKEEIYFLYNKTDNLLEPFYVNSKCLGRVLKFIQKSKIDNDNYIRTYAKALNEVSVIDFYNTLIKDNTPFKDELVLINNYDTKTIFDFDIIKINQRVIKKSLNPSSALKTELISVDTKKMILSISNISNYPIDILGLNHNNKKEIVVLNPIRQILSGQKDTIIFFLPRSFENLFVSKKKKITGFVLPKHIHDLNIKYRVSGLHVTHPSPIIPYQNDIYDGKDLFRTKTTINNREDVVINQETREVYLSKPSITISDALVIPKGYIFKLTPGNVINIINGGKIISYSPLNFTGTIQEPINIYSLDKKGQGILVLSEGQKSKLKFVNFNYLTNPSHGSWSVTGAVTFYESPVILENVTINNNTCEDALNIVRTNFEMTSCSISNTQSDAFDGDFVNGTILFCKFNNLGNDAIDVSGSDLTIKGVLVINAGDKGISAGENSRMIIDDVEISNSEIALTGKDLSIIKARNITISNTRLGIAAFQKKPEFGPSNIKVNGINLSDVETNYLIEQASNLIVDGKRIKTSRQVKERMYGIEFGRSSAETKGN